MDLISDVLSALDSLTQTLAALVTDSPWTYLIVFGLVALDVLFPVLPAEASVLIAAVLAGTGQLSIAWVVVAAGLGAFIGDNVAYWIGRTAGRPIIERLLRGHGERIEQVSAQFHDRGGSFIIIGRFVPGGRTAVSVGAGVLHYPWARFMAYDAVAAVIWALQAAIPGYIGGVVFADRPWIGLAIGVLLAVLITVTIEGLRRYRERRRGSGPVVAVDDRTSGTAVDAGARASRAAVDADDRASGTAVDASARASGGALHAGARAGAAGGLGLSPAIAVPGDALDGGDRDPGTDRGRQEAVVTQPEDRAGAEDDVSDPRPEDRASDGRERAPAEPTEDDEVGARLEDAHEDR
jgi:membrane protein DedA with SNARE-associated domain